MWSVFILRKNKIFNKSRYSRNRQTTRVAFYLSLLINILVIFGIFVLYYKFLFKLGYLWAPFFLFLFSFLFSSYLRTMPVTTFKNFIIFIKAFYRDISYDQETSCLKKSMRFWGGFFGAWLTSLFLRLYNYIRDYLNWGYVNLFFGYKENLKYHKMPKWVITCVNEGLGITFFCLVFTFLLFFLFNCCFPYYALFPVHMIIL